MVNYINLILLVGLMSEMHYRLSHTEIPLVPIILIDYLGSKHWQSFYLFFFFGNI